MTRRPLVLFCAALLLAACNRAPESKEAVLQGVMEHLKKGAALDLNALDVTIADIKYEGNQATAQVSFKPKTSPQTGMTMAYRLERRGSKWEVMGKGAGHGGAMGGGMGQAPAGEMPAGHPPTGQPAPGAAGAKPGELPPGHPPVNQPPKPAK